MGIEDKPSGVRLPMFNGTDGKWHVYKANFLAYA
jgi:hypothetical protein